MIYTVLVSEVRYSTYQLDVSTPMDAIILSSGLNPSANTVPNGATLITGPTQGELRVVQIQDIRGNVVPLGGA